jgi:hypothetical protein
MAINRQGPCQAYFEYICYSAISQIPNGTGVPANVQQLLPPGTSYILFIPPYQRGIEWSREDIEDFINSSSVLLGNVIMGYFPPVNYNELVDGLQRFSVGTGILHNLWAKALSAAPTNAIAGQLFQTTVLPQRLQLYFPIVQHNHNSLMNHPRRAISEQYAKQYDIIDSYVNSYLGNPVLVQTFVTLISNLFWQRQVSIDQYVGFQDSIQLSNTFIGLNTIRVELSAIDLLRSYIVQKGYAANWTPVDIDRIENDITDTFVSDNGKVEKLLEPFAKVCLFSIQSANNLSPLYLFPNWANLTTNDVTTFLDFVETFQSLTDFTNGNKYIYEVSKCGGLSFSLWLMHYYQEFIQQNLLSVPQFIQNIQATDLHILMRATYRIFLESNLGRLYFLLENSARRQYMTASALAEAINGVTGAGLLANQVNRNWLIQALGKVDKAKAQRVFNAALLPNNANAMTFAPLLFGKRNNSWNIDHIIPSVSLVLNNPGYDEGDRIQNFSPVLRQYNERMNNTPAQAKLGNGNLYDQMIQDIRQNGLTLHPYLLRLINITRNTNPQSSLNDQTQLLLTANATNIGDQRISEIADVLVTNL